MPEETSPSAYKDRFSVCPLPDDRTWVINSHGFGYEVGHLGSGDLVSVPLGFMTDFASIPRAFRWWLGPWGRHGRAAVIHDYLYWTQTRTRREADFIFREAMCVHHVGWLSRWLMWAAVRSPGGWLAWRGNAAKRAEGGTRIMPVYAIPFVVTDPEQPAL